MKKLMLVSASAVVISGVALSFQPISAQNAGNTAAWEKQAQNITIIRDNWGIAHVYGKTDADAVFGVVYAQAEDDFNRVETNFINGMGRLAEAEGESAIYRDLRMKLYIDPDDVKAKYQSSPQWLKALMNAWADGLNYYLATHPKTTPRVIKHFEPWMALTFSEGSIGGDIERINLTQLEAFYGGKKAETAASAQALLRARQDVDDFATRQYEEPTGSNGAAIAPSNTTARHALLLINPHTSFFFRSETQMISDEGLNAYGAITWGQFFIYQGFNDRAGWMHTSSGVDNIDEYLETVAKKGDGYVYKYGGDDRPVKATKIVVPYKTAGGMAKKEFTVYRTHHGPVVRELDGKWVSVRLMQDEVKALTQSYSRTKAKSYKAFTDTMELHTNSSNNTIYADADGNIAYFHSNFIPRRDPSFDWTKPVDGTTRATEWDGVLSIAETPGLLNPATGWLFNVNNWPWSAAGPNSPKKGDYPAYVDRGTAESPRGVHGLRVFSNKTDFTLDGLIAAAYDSYLPSFAVQIPPLVKAWDNAPPSNPLKAKLQEPIEMLRSWDYRWSATSIPTSLGQYYGEEIGRRVGGGGRGNASDDAIAQRATADQMLQALTAACDKLAADFGTWRTPWGDINRYQRNDGAIAQVFDDKKPSVPVAFTSSRWGSLASFG
ncbi:MAG TPA: penicillin acylase family protein, partial [Vicinamibacterales bacterium]|nr:penicillin acylase family protein [Vicinamibacterales bacterium]